MSARATPFVGESRRWRNAWALALSVGVVAMCACDDGPGPAVDQTKRGGAGPGGAAGSGGATVKQASFTISKGTTGCPVLGASTARVDTSYVVQWTLVDECTGLGGQYVVAKDLDGSRRFFLGGHGCYALPTAEFPTFPAPPLRYGVLRGIQTAALFTAGPCIDLPADPPDPSPNPTTVDEIQTDLNAEILEVYETLEDARAAR